jgi:hypothetical protein
LRKYPSDIIAGAALVFGGLYFLLTKNLAGLAIAAIGASWLGCAYYWRKRTGRKIS